MGGKRKQIDYRFKTQLYQQLHWIPDGINSPVKGRYCKTWFKKKKEH